jgi:16S rRNA processing protein RimM
MTGAKSELLQVARVLKSNGTEGEVLVGFRGISPEDLNVKEPVFIEFDGLPVPFFIESFTRKGSNRAIARLTGVKNLADAEELAGKDVFAVKEAIDSGEDEDFLSPDELTGWTLLDADNRTVGEISGYEDIPGNLCVYVETADGQAMIPLHEDLILSVDENSRTITVAVPDGLL